jgi:hypothetical protein
MTFKDWRGTEIHKGSTIIYATGSSSSVDVVEAEVLDVIPTENHHTRWADRLDEDMQKNGFDQQKFDSMENLKSLGYKLKVRRTRMRGGFSSWQDENKIITLQSVERVVVLQ